MQALDQAESQWQPGAQRHVVDPSDLRKALAALQGRSYAEGDMHDAGGWRLGLACCGLCCTTCSCSAALCRPAALL